jgi:tetratricopeptide (TPR) repeat protein
MSLSETHRDDFLPGPARAAAPYFVLALAVFAVYGNIFGNTFLFDDDLLIRINVWLRDWSHIGDILTGSTTGGAHIAGGFYRPAQMLLYLILYHLGEGSVFGFHCLNLVLHIANTCLVYKLGSKLKFAPEGVFLAALVWGLHPLHTEAVTYMSGTADPLFAFCCLTSIIILLPDFTPRKILAIFPLFLLGLLSKETMVMFPLLVMICLYFTSPNRLKFRTYMKTWPLWVVSLAYVGWRMQAKGFDGPQTFSHYYGMPEFSALKMYAEHPLDRIYTFFATLPAYLKLLIWPTGLHMERSFGIYAALMLAPVIEGIGLILCAAGVVFYEIRTSRARALSWGLLWFAAAHSPDTGLLIPMNALFLEHWMYLPTVGLFLGIAQTLAMFLQKRNSIERAVVMGAALGMAAIFSVMTYQQNAVWHDPVSFYENIFANGENSARARNNLALYYSDQHEYAKALDQFRQAVKVSDTYAETRYNLAITYLHLPDRSGNIQMAIENLNRSLQIDPGFYRSYQLLGEIYGTLLGDKEKADYYNRLGSVLANKLR